MLAEAILAGCSFPAGAEATERGFWNSGLDLDDISSNRLHSLLLSEANLWASNGVCEKSYRVCGLARSAWGVPEKVNGSPPAAGTALPRMPRLGEIDLLGDTDLFAANIAFFPLEEEVCEKVTNC